MHSYSLVVILVGIGMLKNLESKGTSMAKEQTMALEHIRLTKSMALEEDLML